MNLVLFSSTDNQVPEFLSLKMKLAPVYFFIVLVVKAVHHRVSDGGFVYFAPVFLNFVAYIRLKLEGMREKININQWKRREIYNFFKDYEEPYYGINVDLDCTVAYEYAKQKKISFFLYYLYLILKAVNQTEALKYRIEGDDLFLYDVINGSATIDRDDGTFGFSYIPYFEDLALFLDKATEEMIDVRMSDQLIKTEIGENIIHFSSVPWIKFTSVSHPRRYSRRDSIPKVTVGKYHMEGKKMKIPVSVHVNHAVADGLHIGEFYEKLQQLFDGL